MRIRHNRPGRHDTITEIEIDGPEDLLGYDGEISGVYAASGCGLCIECAAYGLDEIDSISTFDTGEMYCENCDTALPPTTEPKGE